MPAGFAIVTPPVGELVSLPEVKDWLRVDPGDTSQDGEISLLLRVAREFCETWTDRSLISQTLQYGYDRYPRYSSSAVWQYNSDAIWQQRLPVTQLSGQWYPDRAAILLTRSPVQQVNAIGYVDGAGVNQSLWNIIPAGVTGTGSQTVTPASMFGVAVGSQFTIDTGAAQELVTVSAVGATTFTATFAATHGINVLMQQAPAAYVAPLLLANVDYSTSPCRIAPAYAQIWPIVRQQLSSVRVQFVAGYGPSTTIAANIASGSQTVTPASMAGIYPPAGTYLGTLLNVDDGANREQVVVTAATATTFTATFAKSHTGPVNVTPAVPNQVLAAVRLLVGHWYYHRDALGDVSDYATHTAVESLLQQAWPGTYY